MQKSTKSQGQRITNKKVIIELLNIAREHLWKFYFRTPHGLKEKHHITEIHHVNGDENYIVVSSIIDKVCPGSDEPIVLHSTDTGVQLGFNSVTLPFPGNPLADQYASERRIKLPASAIFSQKREAVRVNFADLDNIPMAMFTDKGKRLLGSIADISFGGVKALFPGYLVEPFEENTVIADCTMVLSPERAVQCRVEILESSYDLKSNHSLIRCRFLELEKDTEIKIRELLKSARATSLT